MAKVMIGSVYDAFRDAGASDEKSRAAAEDVANFDNRIVRVESDLTLLKWMVGANIALTVAVLTRLLTL